jgi:hypothetical protein
METKICKKCGFEKETCEFGILRKNIDGFRDICKKCKIIQDVSYIEKNKEKIKEIKLRWVIKNPEYKKKYYQDNKERLKKESRSFYQKNKTKYNQQSTDWNSENKQKRKEIIKKHKEKPEVKLKEKIRHRVYMFLKTKNLKKNNKTFQIVGCSPTELKEHLEKQFTGGMNWDNQGKWHIDHIVPLSSAKTEQEIYNLCHYSNLQPLWAEENMKKGNKIL